LTSLGNQAIRCGAGITGELPYLEAAQHWRGLQSFLQAIEELERITP